MEMWPNDQILMFGCRCRGKLIPVIDNFSTAKRAESSHLILIAKSTLIFQKLSISSNYGYKALR
jgi:hypothetical protein